MRETEREREIEWFHVISQLANERERESMGECVSEIGKRERERERERERVIVLPHPNSRKFCVGLAAKVQP